MHVVDAEAYSLPDATSTILPTATPVDLPACSTVPIASTSTSAGIGRIIFTLNSKVVWILPLGRVVITAHAIALSRIVPYHPPCNVPIGLREAKLGFPLKTTLPFSTACTL